MNRRVAAVLSFLLFFASSCAPASATPTRTQGRVVPVYFTFSTAPWISEVYACAAQTESLILARVDSPSDAEISFRLGEPPHLESSAFQIDEAEIVLAVNAKNPVRALTDAEVAAIFRGQIRNWQDVGGNDAEIHVWAYDEESDLQRAFEDAFLEGAPPFSMTRLAPSLETMRSVIAEDEAAVGILLLRGTNADVRAIRLNQILPVLAVSKSEPQGEIRALLACLQR